MAADPDLAQVVEAHGPPPTRKRPEGFATLLQIIVNQQVSIAAAASIWKRFEAAYGAVTPEAILASTEEQLRALGLSGQKVRYAHELAGDVTQGRLKVDRLRRLDDEAAIAALTTVKGIGRWTAEIYLLSALQRQDVWPAADLALMVAAQEVKGLARRPKAEEMIEIAEQWRPWRAVAARLLWHHYRHSGRRDVGL